MEGVGAPLRTLPAVDVAVLGADLLVGNASSLFRHPALAYCEVVVAVDDPASPARFGLESRGFRYVVTTEQLLSWLPPAFSPLAAVARARRLLAAAAEERPRPPELPPPMRTLSTTRLRVAEGAFRDVLLRLLLAEFGTRRRAAEEAGVPYRSFCAMLRKRGLGGATGAGRKEVPVLEEVVFGARVNRR